LAGSGGGDDDTDPMHTPPVITGPIPLPRLGETRFDSARAGAGGRRRPAQRRDRQRRARRGALYIGSACVVGLALAAGGTVTTTGDGTRHQDSPAPGSLPAAAGSPRSGDCPGAEPPAADVDGDGCPEPVRVNGRLVDVSGRRWTLGEPGDLAAVGDWDCNGSASPALLRPATGDVFVFDRWAADEPVTVHALDSVGSGAGAVQARRSAAGCDALVVTVPNGDVTVEVDQ
jgi:hypothetical protein